MGVICRNSPNKTKKEKKCQFLKSLGRGYLSEQSHQKKGEKVSILEKLRKRLFVRTVPPKKKEEKCQFLKSLGRGYLSEQSHKKKEKKCQFLKSLGRGYLSEQSHQKKGEKESILEKFRKRLFVGTVPPKKRRKSVNS